MKFMTLYKKPWAKVVPDFWAEETENWINFPWEPFEVLRDIIEKPKPTAEKAEEVRNAGFGRRDLGLYLRVVAAGKNASLQADAREISRALR
jgi:hypothetical protein